MNKPEYIYFDLDDTLLDHKKAEKFALKETREEFSFLANVPVEVLTSAYHAINKQLWHEYNHGRIDKHTLQHLRFANTFQQLDIPVYESAKVAEVYMACYEKYWDWVDGAAEVFDELASTYQVGILTNGFTETQIKKLKKFGLDQSTRHQVISEEIGFLKPDPRIFEYATKISGKPKDQILYVGDSFDSDILGGSSFGWKTAWFNKEYSGQMDPADLVFSHFSLLKERLL